MRPLGGKPLVAWIIEAARLAKRLDRVVVSSDDPEVLRVAATYDRAMPLERPADLATDQSPAIDFVRHALERTAADDQPFDAIAILQPTSPFTLPDDIDGTIELLERSGADSAVTIMRLDHAIHPAKLKSLSGDRLLPYLEEERGRMAAHELPDVYVRNCSVYVTRRATIERGQVIGDDCRAYVMPRERSLDINDEQDFLFAEFLLSKPAGPA